MCPDYDASGALCRGAHIGELLVSALHRHRGRPALQLDDRVMTAGEVAAEISRYGQAFDSLGITKGHAAAVLSANRPEVLIALGATMVDGIRTTALHPLGAADDHAFALEQGAIETLLFDPDHFEDRAGLLLDRVPSLQRIVPLGESGAGPSLPSLAATFGARRLRAADLRPDDLAMLVYTGGTTGRPKGVMITQGNLSTMTVIQMAEWDFAAGGRMLITTPLSHAGAAFFVPTLLRGGCLVVLQRFDPSQVLDLIERERITATMVVPTMLYALLDQGDLEGRDLSSLQTMYYGAAAASPSRLRDALERIGPVLFQFYGQSECPMTAAVLAKHDHDPNRLDRLATCGRPVPWLTVGVLDDDGDQVPVGEPGEICVRGPLVMAGYWNDSEQTAEAFRGGWLHTGDVARMDDEGFLTIVDRKKDMIVTGGFNVFPREIEDVIAGHPAVAQVAVIGVPDAHWGEAVKAVVVCRLGRTVGSDELVARVKVAKGSLHAPKSVDFVERLPLTPVGKPDKVALRAGYWIGANRLVN